MSTFTPPTGYRLQLKTLCYAFLYFVLLYYGSECKVIFFHVELSCVYVCFVSLCVCFVSLCLAFVTDRAGSWTSCWSVWSIRYVAVRGNHIHHPFLSHLDFVTHCRLQLRVYATLSSIYSFCCAMGQGVSWYSFTLCCRVCMYVSCCCVYVSLRCVYIFNGQGRVLSLLKCESP
jgi:hypothetical protein